MLQDPDDRTDPANREEVIALLMTQPNTGRALAGQLYEEQLNVSGNDRPHPDDGVEIYRGEYDS